MFNDIYKPPDRDNYMEGWEIQALIAAAGKISYNDWELLAFMANTGVRSKEVKSVTPSCLYQQALVVRVQTAKQRQGKVKIRDIDVTKPIMDMLISRVRRKKISPDKPIFRIGRHGIYKVFKRAATQAGLRECYSPKALRHSRAIYLLDIGGEPVYVQRQLGHSNLAITMVYLHLTEKWRTRIRQVMRTLG